MTRASGPRSCDHCSGTIDAPDRRKRYHDSCRTLARDAAKIARRKCPKCRKIKAASKFSNDSTRVDGKFPWCVDCQTTGNTSKRFQESDGGLNGHTCPMCLTEIRGHANRRFCSLTCKGKTKALREKYDLTPAEYRALLADNDGKCPLCLKRIHAWNTDHNHKTGRVTGVVCLQCNTGALASTFHDVEYVKRLLAYLENPPADRLGIEAIAPKTEPSKLHRRWRRGAPLSP